MKTKKELEDTAKRILDRITMDEDETEVFLLSADYASVSNLLMNYDDELRFLIYEDLKKEFED